MGVSGALRDVTSGAESAIMKSDLARSSIDQKVKTTTGNILQKYKSDFQKILDTKTAADLKFEGGRRQAETAYEQELLQAESIPKTFWEGFFG